MILETLIKRSFLSISITNACPLNCRICFKSSKYSALSSQKMINLSVWKKFVDQLYELFPQHKETDISGGEPLVYENLCELIKYISVRGSKIGIATNGYLLNRELLKRLSDSGLNKLAISLDSLDPFVHDYIRGVTGVYQRVIENISMVIKDVPHVTLGIHTVLTGLNLHGIKMLYNFVKETKGISYIYFQAVMKPLEARLDKGWYLKSPFDLLWPDIVQVKEVLNFLLEEKLNIKNKIGNSKAQLKQYGRYYSDPENFYKLLECRLSDYFIMVSPEGNIQSCFSKSGPLGSIEDTDFKEIYRQIKENLNVSGKKDCREGCFFLLNCFGEKESMGNVTVPELKAELKRIDHKIADTTRPEKPSYSSLIIENSCLMRCKMCHYWKNKEPKSLSFEKFKKIMALHEQLLNKGIPIQLTGGEPLLNPEIYEMIKYGAKLGFLMAIVTSGYTLTDKNSEKLAATPLFTLSYSVDSLIPERQDFLRGRKDVLLRIFESMKILKKLNPEIRIDILTTIMEINLEELLELVDWADSEKLVNKIYFQTVTRPIFYSTYTKDFRNDEDFWFLWPKNSERVATLIDSLSEKKKKGSKINNTFYQLDSFKKYYLQPDQFKEQVKCRIYRYALNTDVEGNFYFCYAFPPIGNAEELTVDKILFSEETMKLKAKIKNCRESCMFLLNCIYNEKNFDRKT